MASTKKTSAIETNFTSAASTNFHIKKSKELLYFAYSFISSQIIVDIHYLLLLCKTKRHNYFNKFVLKVARVFISIT